MIMILTCKGGTKRQRKVIEEAVVFFIENLLPQARSKKGLELVITVKLVEKLFQKYSTKALCILEDDDPWEFELKVDSTMKLYPILVSLAHECVHLAQYYSGDMEEREANSTRWRGKEYDLKKTNYWDRPWEIEAYGKEIGLVEKFVTKFKYSETSWYLRDPDYL